MDCHALSCAKARNDGIAALSSEDSRETCSLGLWFSLLLLDSRIVDEKGLLCVLFSATCSRKDFCDKNGALLKKHRLRRAVSLVLQGDSRELP